MSEIDELLDAYCRFAAIPWQANIAGPQKVWFAIYDPGQERRLRLRLDEFALATQAAGHAWRAVDLTDSFAHWMAGQPYREAYFASPDDLGAALDGYEEWLTESVQAHLTAADVSADTVVALVGLGSLFGLTHASTLIEGVARSIRGRLLVFFPGHFADGNYRLLDARDGWNYLAVPIKP